MEDIKSLCAHYLELKANFNALKTSLGLVETSLEKHRSSLNPDCYAIPHTFYLRLNKSLYQLDFDTEDGTFVSLKEASDVQIIE